MKKFLSLFIVLGLVVGFGFLGVGSASAQTATFPTGCTSALGYSTTNGIACNGTGVATIGPLAGCTTALGYSTANGVPCSGGSFAITYLAGCTSILDYSAINGAPCNGTTVATLSNPSTGGTGTNPGLPTTGAGGNVGGVLFVLLGSGIVAISGFRYFSRNSKNA